MCTCRHENIVSDDCQGNTAGNDYLNNSHHLITLDAIPAPHHTRGNPTKLLTSVPVWVSQIFACLSCDPLTTRSPFGDKSTEHNPRECPDTGQSWCTSTRCGKRSCLEQMQPPVQVCPMVHTCAETRA